MNLLSKQLYRILPVTYTQPLLSQNNTAGGTNFAVSHWFESAQSGTGASGTWYAFNSVSGYNGSYITCYRDESRCALNLEIYTPVPTRVTGISYYIPTVNSDMNWGAVDDTQFYAYGAGGNLIQLLSTDDVGQDYQASFSFSNPNYYQYYRFRMRSKGAGHKDRLAICSFRLNAVYEDFV